MLLLNYYLIDFENVRTDGIKDLNGVSEGDAIILFYSEQCKNISLDVIDSIMKLHVQYSSFKAKVGTKNALDFQLVAYLGYLIGQGDNQESKYYIVSNDKGYDCLCDYWKELDAVVKRISLSKDVPEVKAATVPKSPAQPKKKRSKVKASDMATIDEMKQLLSNDDMPEEVLKIFNQYKTKVAINNGLVKRFKDTKRASAIYKKLKPLLKEKNKS